MSTKILFRRGTGSEWSSANPILSLGEPGLVTDATPPMIKIGDGVSHWNDLSFFAASPTLNVQAPILIPRPIQYCNPTCAQVFNRRNRDVTNPAFTIHLVRDQKGFQRRGDSHGRVKHHTAGIAVI